MSVVTHPLEPVRVLLVEDDEDDYLITRDMLARQERARFAVDWSSQYHESLRAIRECNHDVYLIDYRLGAHTGLELVREGFAARPYAPVIMLTGEATYEMDLEATALGVTDYLVKQKLDSQILERSIRYAISHQKAIRDLSLSEERYSLAVRAANDGIWDWDLGTGRIYFSPRWHAILGRPEQAADEDPAAWFDLVHSGDVLRLRGAIEAHLDGRTPHLQSEHRMRHADGTWRWVMTRGLAIRGVDGRPTRMAGSLSDITDRRIAQLRLQHDALHDTLTGLPNRTLFMDRVNQILQRAIRDPQTGCAVLFLDIDRFKLVNDSLSHAVGDNLLIALAGRVAAALRPGDTVARLGGDEFTVLLEDVVEPEDATVVADRILHSLDEAFEVDGNELFVTASIGISLSSTGLGSADLMRNADIAMYDAKRRGRSRSAVFDESMHRRVVDRLARETELRQVVECSLLGIHYQPIIDLASGNICGLEALARWPADWPHVPPAEFITIAEETGVIGALGQQVLRRALVTLAGWRAEGLISNEVCMSVNLSGRQLDDPGLAEQVRAAINSAELPPNALKLEITESTLMQEIERTQHVFSEVCGSGVGLHLDDFGTGYSSLTALHRFPVDALKIDRSFVATISSNGEQSNDVIVRSTVALAHSLGLPVIAEGIEAPDQLRRLRSLGCEFGQGYLFSKALSAEDTRVLLEGWSPSEIMALGAPV
ncbi:MAG TPA: EAL domain-containing protein [Solirubrobacteraceae bacterium]|nr:EAL domain-containing protein [Solirubrobacteraceae bacterium]